VESGGRWQRLARCWVLKARAMSSTPSGSVYAGQDPSSWTNHAAYTLDNQPVCGVGATAEDGGPPVC
jgi:hypothetical protein